MSSRRRSVQELCQSHEEARGLSALSFFFDQEGSKTLSLPGNVSQHAAAVIVRKPDVII
jgi:thioredoxin-related protein